MAEYKAVFNGESLYHINKNHGRHGWFATGDGDGDGIIDDHHNQRKSTRNRTPEYSTSARRQSDSEAARTRLDEYYKNNSLPDDYYTTTGPNPNRRSANPYVDKNGNLTEAGKARFEQEKKANARKSKDKQVKDINALNDPKKWVQDDIKTLAELSKSSAELSTSATKLVDMVWKDKKNPRLDLSQMTDKEIRDAINREIIERQYNDMFNQPTQSKGKEFVKNALLAHTLINQEATTALSIIGLIVALAA